MRVKKRRHPSKSVQVTHSFTGYDNQTRAELKRKHDRAVSYTANCVWKPPTLAEAASAVLAEARMDEEETEEGGVNAPDFGGAWDDDAMSDQSCAWGKEGDDLESDGDEEADEGEWEDVEEGDTKHPVYDERWTAFVYGDKGSEFREPFRYRNNLPPYYMAQVSLMYILSQHKTNDLGIFDRIMNWVFHWTDRYPRIWKNRHAFEHHTRKATLNFLAKMFHMKGTFPKPVTVELSRGKKVTVPIHSFEEQLLAKLSDPELMREENFLKRNFDTKTMRPTKHYDKYGDNDVIDDVNDGYLFHRGIDLYCNAEPPPGVDRIIPCPLMAYADECSPDSFGAESIERVSFAPAFLNNEARMRYPAWFHVGYLPNTKVGEGTNADNYDDDWHQGSAQFKKKNKKDVRTSVEKVEDTQKCYRCVLKSIVDCCDKGGLKVRWRGENCLFKPFLLCGISDAKGSHQMCAANNCLGNANCSSLCKECTCSFLELASHRPQCRYITLEDRERSYNDPAYAKEISHSTVRSAWNELPMAENIEGINGCTPYELLHAFGHGSYQDGPLVIHNLMGKNKSKAAEKESLDMLFQAVAYEMRASAEKRVPRIVIRFGLMDLSRVTGLERKGNYLVLMASLSTERGREIVRPFLREREIEVSDVVETMSMMLAFDEWCYRPKYKWELDNAEDAVSHLMKRIKDYLPMDVVKGDKKEGVEGCNGYHKVKFHAIWLLIRHMRKFGGAINFDSGPGEEHHKDGVNKAGRQTQRRTSSFATQTLQRDSENAVIRSVFKLIQHECPEDQRNLYEKSTREVDKLISGDASSNPIKTLGRYDLYCTPVHERKRNRLETEFSVVWADRKKKIIGQELHDGLYHGLASYSEQSKINYRGRYSLQGYTSMTVQSEGGNIIYWATDDYQGVRRYDWALIREPTKNGPVTYIAQLYGFVRYTTPGYPTHKLVKIDGHSPKKIAEESMTDDTLYCVYRASEAYVGEDDLAENIVMPFKMEDSARTYVLPASYIARPLIVVRDFGSRSQTAYLHVLAKKYWNVIFTRWIKHFMEKNKSKKRSKTD